MDNRNYINYADADELLKFNELQLLTQPSFVWTLLALGSCILFVMLAFTPLFFGFVLIIFLILTLAKVMGFVNLSTNNINFMSNFSRDAFVCYVFRKQTNENFLCGADKVSNLRQILETAMGGRMLATTTDLERVLVIFPPDRSPMSRQGLRLRSEDAYTTPKGHINRSAQRMSYFDLSMRKYQESPYDLYKEEKPIVFKFIPNRTK
ncbi:unnamed protein product [Orchesella dallaii]|uniref:Uncharacterized protein n=1 Tax=Orchesella dallaii TaxID=48710 RepID=A0ABP1R493_9HEXA